MASIADSIAASTSTGVSTMKASSPRTACNFPAASPSKALASAIAWRSLRTSASASGFMWTYNVNEPSYPLPPARKLIPRPEDRQAGEAAALVELQHHREMAQQLTRQLPDKVAVRRHLAALVLPHLHRHHAGVEANLNPTLHQPHQPVRHDRPIRLPEPAGPAAMGIEHLHLQLRAVEINRVVHHRRRPSMGKGVLGGWHGPAANPLLSLARQQHPGFPRPTNQAADLARQPPLSGPPPSAAMVALQRQKLPRQPELLRYLRQPLCLRPRTLQRRIARDKVHAADEPTQLPVQVGGCGPAIHFATCAFMYS